MSQLYFPGCKYTAHAPEKSERLSRYLHERFGLEVTGCCSVYHKALSEQDTAVYICPTCSAILEESAPQAQTVSVWELLAEDDQFPWPAYRGKRITVQDCWRTHDHRKMQDAIRAVLKRMGFEIVEIENSYERAAFCGISLLSAPSPRYEQLAPRRFIQNADGRFQPCTKEVQTARMQEHCRQYVTEEVVCYCTACLEGLRIGGVKGVHLMDLVMGPD